MTFPIPPHRLAMITRDGHALPETDQRSRNEALNIVIAVFGGFAFVQVLLWWLV